ncbi:MAG: phosphatase PAP2 family protein [Myxococcales bacterium]|nr:phosphatase PAP2 family protein [Myxococcales bacterium]
MKSDAPSAPPPPSRPSRASRPWILAGQISSVLFLRWLVLVAAVFVFASLAAAVLAGSTDWLDLPIIHLMDRVRGPTLTALMRAVTFCGNGPTLTAVALVATLGLMAVGQRTPALYVAVTAAGAGALNSLLKLAFSRPRPLILSRLADAGGFSFPSGHSMAGAAIYGAVAVVAVLRFPRQRVAVVSLCALFVSAIGLSRIYLGVHYPSDVLAGWALGISWPLWLRPLLLTRSSVSSR